MSGIALANGPRMPRLSTGGPIARATGAVVKPLWLPHTREDWDSIVSKAGLAVQTTNGIEEVTVTAPADLVPMKVDVYDGMWAGILAPVWGVLHPAEAWRILLPIPPR